MSSSKKPGMLHDPWRSMAEPPAAPPLEVIDSKAVGAKTGEDGDEGAKLYATILYPGYGGISLKGTGDNKLVAAHILAFSREYAALLEPIYLKYGIILVELHTGGLQTPFYIQNSDGWTLAVPGVKERKEGLLQLIQALLEAYNDSRLRLGFKKYALKPFKQ